MSFLDILRTILEFVAVVLVITGFVFEKKLIKFETALWIHIKRFLKKKHLISERGDTKCA